MNPLTRRLLASPATRRWVIFWTALAFAGWATGCAPEDVATTECAIVVSPTGSWDDGVYDPNTPCVETDGAEYDYGDCCPVGYEPVGIYESGLVCVPEAA